MRYSEYSKEQYNSECTREKGETESWESSTYIPVTSFQEMMSIEIITNKIFDNLDLNLPRIQAGTHS